MVNMKNSKHIGAVVCLSLMAFLVYLLRGYLVPFFIPSSYSSSYYWLGVALIPVYIALAIFGMGMLSVYAGGWLQRWARNIFLKFPVKM